MARTLGATQVAYAGGAQPSTVLVDRRMDASLERSGLDVAHVGVAFGRRARCHRERIQRAVRTGRAVPVAAGACRSIGRPAADCAACVRSSAPYARRAGASAVSSSDVSVVSVGGHVASSRPGDLRGRGRPCARVAASALTLRFIDTDAAAVSVANARRIGTWP